MPSPEPCVAVATAPMTEMCGSDAIEGSATPSACSWEHSSAYVMLAEQRAVAVPVRSSRSTCTALGMPRRLSSTPSVSATRENECAVPTTRRRCLARLMIAAASSSVFGVASSQHAKATHALQLKSKAFDPHASAVRVEAAARKEAAIFCLERVFQNAARKEAAIFCLEMCTPLQSSQTLRTHATAHTVQTKDHTLLGRLFGSAAN